MKNIILFIFLVSAGLLASCSTVDEARKAQKVIRSLKENARSLPQKWELKQAKLIISANSSVLRCARALQCFKQAKT